MSTAVPQLLGYWNTRNFTYAPTVGRRAGANSLPSLPESSRATVSHKLDSIEVFDGVETVG